MSRMHAMSVSEFEPLQCVVVSCLDPANCTTGTQAPAHQRRHPHGVPAKLLASVNHISPQIFVTSDFMESSLSLARCSTATTASSARLNPGHEQHSHSARMARLRTSTP